MTEISNSEREMKPNTACPRCGAEPMRVAPASGQTFTCGTWVRAGRVQTVGQSCQPVQATDRMSAVHYDGTGKVRATEPVQAPTPEPTHVCIVAGCKARITKGAFCWDHLPGGDAERDLRRRMSDQTTNPPATFTEYANEHEASWHRRALGRREVAAGAWGAAEARIERIIEARQEKWMPVAGQSSEVRFAISALEGLLAAIREEANDAVR